MDEFFVYFDAYRDSKDRQNMIDRRRKFKELTAEEYIANHVGSLIPEHVMKDVNEPPSPIWPKLKNM